MPNLPSSLVDLGLSSDIEQEVQALDQLDRHIGGLNGQLRFARRKRDHMRHRLDLPRASKAPIRKVPREVLTIIFEQNPLDQEARNASVRLVCRLWNDIVLNTSNLWNNIVLVLEAIEDVPARWNYALACLRRSGDTPLHIHIHSKMSTCITYPFTPALDTFTPSDNYPQSEDFENLWDKVYSFNDNDLDIQALILLMTFVTMRGRRDKFGSRFRSLHVELADIYNSTVWRCIDIPTDRLTELHIISP